MKNPNLTDGLTSIPNLQQKNGDNIVAALKAAMA